MRNDKKALLALCSMAVACAAAAADTTAESLTRIEAETAVLKARARKIEVQAQIASKKAEIAKLTAPAQAGDPTVRSIEGVGSRVYATVQLENGSAMDVRTGDVLPNGMKVESIAANEVVVRKRNQRRYRLASTPPPPAANAGSFGALPGLLPPPPMATPLPPLPKSKQTH
jgi:type IV pilus biogenesis protein PilP